MEIFEIKNRFTGAAQVTADIDRVPRLGDYRRLRRAATLTKD